MNILYIDELNVFSPRFGGEQRSNLLLRACCKVAHVDVVLFKQFQQQPNIENCHIFYEDNIENHYTLWDKVNELLSFNYKCLGSINNRRREKIISELLYRKEYDYIVVRYVPKAINYGLLKYIDRLVVDIDDNPVTCIINKYNLPEHKKWKKLAKQGYLKIKLPFIEKQFLKIVDSLKIAFVSNFEDIQINKSKCIHLPNVPFMEPNANFCDFSVTKKRVIWVGLVNYPPNYLGLEHFFECIYPKVMSKIPDFEVVVCGKYDDFDVSRWRKLQGVSVKGFVEDLESEYSSARAAIVPCYSGAGTNIKVLESMRMKRPCITSEYGARGYDNYFEKNVDYLVCKNDDDFAASIIDMLENEQRNHEISANGFEKVSNFFSKDGFIDIVTSSFNKLTDNSGKYQL